MQKLFTFSIAFLIAATSFAQFPSNNKAAHFSNAADEGISIPYNNSLTFSATQDFTVESWIKTSDAASVMVVFAHQYCPGPSTGTLFYVAAGKMNFNIQDFNYNSMTVTSICSVADNKWHHVAGVRNKAKDSIYIYIDGVLQGQLKDNTISGLSNSNATNWIGRRDPCAGPNNFYGDIDEVRIWNKAKTSTEIFSQKDAELAGNEPGLVAYYNFNTATNGNGQTVINNCTNTGAVLNGTTQGTSTEPSFNTAQPQSEFVPCDPVLWLKADAGVYTDAGVTPATNGQAVQQWNDQSGNANHVTQTVAINKPVFKSPDATAQPALYFDGVNGKYFLNNTSSNLVPAGSARTVFVAARRDCGIHAGAVVGGELFTFRRAGLINGLSFGANGYGTPVYIYSDNNGVGNNNASIGSNTIDTAFSPFVITYKVPAAGGQLQCNLNSIAQTVNQGSGSVTTETGTTGFTVGDREDQADLDWSGWIYEVIVYARTLTNAEIANVESYLKNKYNTGSSAPFSALPAAQTNSNSLLDDGLWKHSYNSSDNSKLIASIKDYCLDLGTRNDVVYVDATAGTYGGNRYMRRHYVVKPSLNPAGTKRVRLYYTNADFADLQSYVPLLTSASQLVITKYSGTNEDGVYDPSGGTTTFIPSSQITTGTLYGVNYLEFDVTGFSEFWIHTGFSVLPLQFINFTAAKKDNTIELNWKTANEINVNHFEVERSTDGLTFSVIKSLSAKNQQQNSYTITDVPGNQLWSEPQFYYRIKQVDNNRLYKYSNIVRVNWISKMDVSIAPNPVKDKVMITTSARVKEIQLLNMNGQLIKTWRPSASQQYSVANIAAGLYYLRLINDTIIQTEKILIQ
ncbi:MAG: T9SS type A sorting domain-containing protein [Bacteroidetes bacterium]|nr:T9SS type A sorting domain-containing protein [Bacteroidota bacterium]MBS1756796.1 T9SS type A sorting domain-containing protein [Bacteroidota bacterium]